ncbi:hemolysin type calcium-binding protein [Stella humosa]|uniref:Hemolysin type calcium-binding protein n=1 Tax=Stella humosa TaxID=94 RepID=A0A3N1MC65_9PROT|nr:calcium-binding protein [Stella humosa]ROQ01331.1 hemolysin type calcium-binding protein [Stella humosa]BBK31705.1 hypothetical protein STHU_23390 [Stella humosa]
MGDVIELFGSPVRSGGWTEQEKAELYRAASLLGARGLPFDSEFGTTDDGDPWFLFIGRGTGEVLAHFARIDGTFVVHHAAADVVFESRDIRDLVDRVLVFPDRSVGRASGDAFHAHIAVTVAALGLSLESLSQFFEGGEAELAPEGEASAAQADDAPAAQWLLDDDEALPGTDDETIAGDDGGEPEGEPADPAPQVRAVDVEEPQEEPIAAAGDSPTHVDPVRDSFHVDLDMPEGLPLVPVDLTFDGVVLSGGQADDTLVGSDQADFLSGGDGRDLIIANGGDDIVAAEGGNDTVLGGDGNDILAGGTGDDLLHGGKGDDLMLGGAGDDLLYGGKGNDTLQGNAGQDTLSGDSGDDLLLASSGEAVLIGGNGQNVFHFGEGSAVAYAGEDRDIFVFEEGERADVVIHDFDPEMDELYYLNGSGIRVEVDTRSPAGDDLILHPSLGGTLTILFDDPHPAGT